MAYAFNKINSYINKNKDEDIDSEKENLRRSSVSPTTPSAVSPVKPEEAKTKPKLITDLETQAAQPVQSMQPGRPARAKYSPISAKAAARKAAKQTGFTKLPGFIGEVGATTAQNKALLDAEKQKYLDKQRETSKLDYRVAPDELSAATDINVPQTNAEGQLTPFEKVTKILNTRRGNLEAPDLGRYRTDLGLEDLSQRENLRNLLKRGRERYSPGMARLDLASLENQPEFQRELMDLQSKQEELKQYAQGVFDDEIIDKADEIDEEEWAKAKEVLLNQLRTSRDELKNLNEEEKELLQQFLTKDPESEEHKALEKKWKTLARLNDEKKFKEALPQGISDKMANRIFYMYNRGAGDTALKFPHPTIPDKLISREELSQLYDDWAKAQGGDTGDYGSASKVADFYDEAETEKDRRLAEWLKEQPVVKSGAFPEELIQFKPYDTQADTSSKELDPYLLSSVAKEEWDRREEANRRENRRLGLEDLQRLATSDDKAFFGALTHGPAGSAIGSIYGNKIGELLRKEYMTPEMEEIVKKHLGSILYNTYAPNAKLIEDEHPYAADRYRSGHKAPYKELRSKYRMDEKATKKAITKFVEDHALEWGANGVDVMELLKKLDHSSGLKGFDIEKQPDEMTEAAPYNKTDEDQMLKIAKKTHRNAYNALNTMTLDQVVIPQLMGMFDWGGIIIDHMRKGNKDPRLKDKPYEFGAPNPSRPADHKGRFDQLAEEGRRSAQDFSTLLRNAFRGDEAAYFLNDPAWLEEQAGLAQISGDSDRADYLRGIAGDRKAGRHPLLGDAINRPQFEDAILRALYSMYTDAGEDLDRIDQVLINRMC